MAKKGEFYQTILHIALPITLQMLLQSSFSVVDQIMIGQLGTVSIAGIGLAGKFSSIYSVLLSAIAAVAGIMIAQYLGQKDEKEVAKSFYINLCIAIFLSIVFMVLSLGFSKTIMGFYVSEAETVEVAAMYLRIIAFTYIPRAFDLLLSTLLRCMAAATLPLITTFVAAILNTFLNYVFIFGKLGAPKLGVAGAGIATVISHLCSLLVLFVLFIRYKKNKQLSLSFSILLGKEARLQYLKILLPLLVCEFMWTLGENVYSVIYGRIGTDACAAMTLTSPIQMLVIGALSGLSQATGIVIGKTLGTGDYDKAYKDSKKMIGLAFFCSLILSVGLILLRECYVEIYQVEPHVKQMTATLLVVFALFAPVKVQNMTVGAGILRSGGETRFVMILDFIGTWIFGVPLGLLAAFVWNMDIPAVYFLLSLEECVRLAMGFYIFKKKSWMKVLKA